VYYNYTIFKNFRENANFENRVVKTLVAMVTSMFTYTSRRLSNVPRYILGKVAKFSGLTCTLNSFWSYSTLEREASTPHPGLNTVSSEVLG